MKHKFQEICFRFSKSVNQPGSTYLKLNIITLYFNSNTIVILSLKEIHTSDVSETFSLIIDKTKLLSIRNEHPCGCQIKLNKKIST